MNTRIQKLLAHAGVASRRECERLLAEGRIRINGKIVREPGTRAGEGDAIQVDGQPIELGGEPRFLLMYKPRGCVTTLADPQGRTTVLQYLPKSNRRIFPVGRLDYGTEGLLLFTSDGDLAQDLMRPASGIAKTYQVKVRGCPAAADLARLRQPFRLEGRLTRAAKVEMHLHRESAILLVTLTEGRKNHVRELCRRAGFPVMRLRRIAYGPLRDPELRSGQSRPLTSAEIQALRSAVAEPV